MEFFIKLNFSTYLGTRGGRKTLKKQAWYVVMPNTYVNGSIDCDSLEIGGLSAKQSVRHAELAFLKLLLSYLGHFLSRLVT